MAERGTMVVGSREYDCVRYSSEEITARYGRTAQRPVVRATEPPPGRGPGDGLASGDDDALFGLLLLGAAVVAGWLGQ